VVVKRRIPAGAPTGGGTADAPGDPEHGRRPRRPAPRSRSCRCPTGGPYNRFNTELSAGTPSFDVAAMDAILFYHKDLSRTEGDVRLQAEVRLRAGRTHHVGAVPGRRAVLYPRAQALYGTDVGFSVSRSVLAAFAPSSAAPFRRSPAGQCRRPNSATRTRPISPETSLASSASHPPGTPSATRAEGRHGE
jgi:hypothetical protein